MKVRPAVSPLATPLVIWHYYAATEQYILHLEASGHGVAMQDPLQ